jgi:hypothetical protein
MIHKDKFSEEEIKELTYIKEYYRLGTILLDYLIAYIGYESNFNPEAEHKLYRTFRKIKGYFFMTVPTAKRYGMCCNTLTSMSGLEQIKFLFRYLKPYEGKILTPEQLIGILIDPRYTNPDMKTNVFNSKLQCRYPDAKGTILFKQVWEEVNKIYRSGLDGQ